jgi:hypothetical protein
MGPYAVLLNTCHWYGERGCTSSSFIRLTYRSTIDNIYCILCQHKTISSIGDAI